MPRDAVLYVPAQSIQAYKTADRWRQFGGRIQAIPEPEVEFGELYRVVSGPLTAEEALALPEHTKVVVRTHAHGDFGWWKATTTNEATGEGHFATRNAEYGAEHEFFAADYVYDVTVADGKFCFMNSNYRYLPKAETLSDNVHFTSNVTNRNEAETFSIVTSPAIEASSSCAGMYALRASTHCAGKTHSDLHFENHGGVCAPKYYETGSAGLRQPADNNTKTIAPVQLYVVEEVDPSTPTEWHRLLNRESGSNREWSYLSYYPTDGEAEWYIYDKTTGERTAKSKSDLISCGNFAGARTGATKAQTEGQLWAWVEGTGEYAGKYCLVNKAHLSGAVSSRIVDNSGAETTGGTNTSRWVYTPNRKAQAANVCWFDLSDTVEADGVAYLHPQFENPASSDYKYIALAGNGQKYQVMRYTGGETSTQWLQTPEHFDPISEYEAQTAPANAFNTMKELIGGEEFSATAPYHTTPDNVDSLAAAAVRPYAMRFDKKIVRIQNFRRNNQNRPKSWLGIALNDSTTTIDGLVATTNGADLWLMLVNDQAKVTLRSLATGHNVSQATNSTLSAGAQQGTVMFKVGSNYMNLHQTTDGITHWYADDDTGSMWYVTLADEALATPEAGAGYYRIVSDGQLLAAHGPNLGVSGEDREQSGEGEAVATAAYGSAGIYWQLLPGEAEGAVKLVNMVDEYGLGGNTAATQQAEGADLYLHALGNGRYAIKSTDSTEGNICLTANAGSETAGLTLNGAALSAEGATADLSAATFYFLPAGADELTRATEHYIAAVSARLDPTQITDDTDNVIALIGEEKAQDYVDAITYATGGYPTIAAVNNARRNNFGIAPIMTDIIARHLGLQHVQLSTTKQGWNSRFYMGTNADGNLHGTADASAESTLWSIISVGDGYLLLYNEQAQKFVGRKTGMKANGTEGHFPLVDEADAQLFAIGYNMGFASFYFCQAATDHLTSKAVIHQGSDSGNIVNWNTVNASNQPVNNSHWYMHALPDAICTDYRINGENVEFTLNGELTEMAAANGMVITVTPVEEEEETPAPAEVRRRAPRASHTVGADDIEQGNTFSLPLTDGYWKVSIPGGMVKSAAGHTRAAETVYKIEGTTGIEQLNADTAAPTRIYDLQGRRVGNAARRGIYISNGRKLLTR